MEENEVRVFKMNSGEEFLVTITGFNSDDNCYTIENPVSVFVTPTQDGGYGYAKLPALQYANDIVISKSSVAMQGNPDEQTLDEYKRIVSPIDLPQSSIIA